MTARADLEDEIARLTDERSRVGAGDEAAPPEWQPTGLGAANEYLAAQGRALVVGSSAGLEADRQAIWRRWRLVQLDALLAGRRRELATLDTPTTTPVAMTSYARETIDRIPGVVAELRRNRQRVTIAAVTRKLSPLDPKTLNDWIDHGWTPDPRDGARRR